MRDSSLPYRTCYFTCRKSIDSILGLSPCSRHLQLAQFLPSRVGADDNRASVKRVAADRMGFDFAYWPARLRSGADRAVAAGRPSLILEVTASPACPAARPQRMLRQAKQDRSAQTRRILRCRSHARIGRCERVNQEHRIAGLTICNVRRHGRQRGRRKSVAGTQRKSNCCPRSGQERLCRTRTSKRL